MNSDSTPPPATPPADRFPLGPALSQPAAPRPQPTADAAPFLPPFFAGGTRDSGAGAERGADDPSGVPPLEEEAFLPPASAAAGAEPAPAVPEAEPPTADLGWLDEIDWTEATAPSAAATPAPPPTASADPVAEAAPPSPESGYADLPDWMTWVEEEPPVAVPGAPATGADAVTDEPPIQDIRSLLPEPEEAAAVAPQEPSGPVEPLPVEPQPAGATAATDDGAASALAEVADRLEAIAARLRQRTPEALLAEGASTDPLELLLTGFALGYASARNRSRE